MSITLGESVIRPWHTWLIFGVCLLVVLAAMSWVSYTALRLDKAQAEAQRLAALEENVRLALWRMDSSLATLIAQENSQPWFAYSSFYSPEQAYGAVDSKKGGAEALIPSPLLVPRSPFVLLHFQIAPDGEVTSPEVPRGGLPSVFMTNEAMVRNVESSIPRLEMLRPVINQAAFASLPKLEMPPPIAIAPQPPPPRNYNQAEPPAQQSDPMAQAPLRKIPSQQSRSVMEQQQRSQMLELNVMQDNIASNRYVSAGDTVQSVMQPLWLGDTLVLARRVNAGGASYIQGCRLDWPGIRHSLVESAQDLLPSADVRPVKSDADRDPTHMLAALPVKLIPGPIAVAVEEEPSPLRFSLFVAWGSVVLAAVAVAVLLLGTLALSERRATFVSAVTHELRTPLTTFRMYTEMLAARLVSEDKRQRYLDTLHAEAERLSHLVENVLSYARLENHRGVRRMETATVQELIDRTQNHLAERVRQAGREFVVDAPSEALSAGAMMDISAVEQILLNLVDNARKYSASAADSRIHLEAALDATNVALRVRDHGPGISRSDARKLFRPFSKSAREAANSAPGVGLGLALSRRLARSMGGDLRLDDRVRDGACFELLLRRA